MSESFARLVKVSQSFAEYNNVMSFFRLIVLDKKH